MAYQKSMKREKITKELEQSIELASRYLSARLLLVNINLIIAKWKVWLNEPENKKRSTGKKIENLNRQIFKMFAKYRKVGNKK